MNDVDRPGLQWQRFRVARENSDVVEAFGSLLRSPQQRFVGFDSDNTTCALRKFRQVKTGSAADVDDDSAVPRRNGS